MFDPHNGEQLKHPNNVWNFFGLAEVLKMYPRIISRNASIKYHRVVIPSGVTDIADFNLHRTIFISQYITVYV